jgi:hypothetical protein
MLFHVSEQADIEVFEPRWSHDAVVASSLQFSMIRMRNAQSRAAAMEEQATDCQKLQ